MNTNSVNFFSDMKLGDDLLIGFLILIILLLMGVIFLVVQSILSTRSIEKVLARKFRNGEYNEVIRMAKAFVDNRSNRNKRDNVYVMYYLAQAYEAMDSLTSALKFYTEANVMSSSSKNKRMRESILFHMAKIYDKLGKHKEALAYYLMLIEQDEQNSEALYEIALLQYKHKNVKKAREFLEKALKLRPGLLDARFLYGKLLYESNTYSAALKQFELLQRYDPENFEVFYYKAKCLENLKKYHEAIKEYQGLLTREWEQNKDPKLNKVREESRISIITLYIKIKDYMTGIQYVSEYLSKPSSEAAKTELIYLYANLLWNTGDEYSALKNFERAYMMNKDFKDSGIMYERYKKILPHSYLSHYFTSNEESFDGVAKKVLSKHQFTLQYRNTDFYIYSKGVFYVIFYRHIEPIPFSKLTDMEIILNSYEVKPQNTEIYTISGVREDAVTHFLLKGSRLIEGDEFIRTIKKLYGK